MDKMKMHTVDVIEENIKRIAELFPNCLSRQIAIADEYAKLLNCNTRKKCHVKKLPR